jgi:hypothetical protein
MTDADRFHIPPSQPCTWCGPGFIGICPHRAAVTAPPAASTAPFSQVKFFEQPPPTVDLSQIVAWFRDELARERTAAADAKIEARGHREEVVKLEARLAEATKPRYETDYKSMLEIARSEWAESARRYVAQIKNLEKRAERAESKLGRANCERDLALERLAAAKSDVTLAAMSSPMLTPGSAAAIKEAVRLVCGNRPTVVRSVDERLTDWWAASEALNASKESSQARLALLKLLETLEPAASHVTGGEP